MMMWLLVVLWMCVFCSTCASNRLLSYNITEEQGKGIILGNIANDANLNALVNNSDDFRKLRYTFLNQGHPQTHRFTIDEKTSDFKTAANLDREEICAFQSACDISLEIAAQSSLGTFFEKIRVIVHLEDINDNSPVFPNPSVDLKISEASVIGSKFTIEGAIDQDSQKFSVQDYSIKPIGTPFSVSFMRNLDGSSTVKLAVNNTLDREMTEHYNIQVLALDGGSPSKIGMLRVNISITDVNDNSPIFESSNYNLTVKEDVAVNTTILHLRANDKDIGKNGEVLYKISTNQPVKLQEMFFINEQTGELKIAKQLMYQPHYRLIVEAHDQGSQPLMNQTFVNVYVQNSRNNPPIITINLLTSENRAKVSEYANQGAVVSHVQITDDDLGANGIITCTIDNDQFKLQKFDVDVKEYKVIVNKQLDRETKDQHHVSISCHDIGNPPLHSNKSFIVQVTDENDQDPQFSQPSYNAKISEGNSVGDAIIQVQATDRDLGKNAKIHYKLHGDAGADFRIDSDTGTIRANRVYDRESVSQYRFRVYAVDGGDPPRSSTATITLDIDDINDNFPEFSQSVFKASVEENVPLDTFVLQLTATDKDAAENGNVIYSLPQNSDVPFFVSPVGRILTNGNLNREIKNRYDFTVIASDRGHPPNKDSVNVVIDITDDNDNEPIIVFPNASNDTVRVSYTSQLNALVAQIQAFDIDEGENKTLVYSIKERNDSDIFNINSLTGEVIVAKHLHAGHVNHYFLRIAVSDRGKKPLTKYENLHLVVVKSNATLGRGSIGQSEDELNMRIVVTVVVLTVILSAAILIVIFFVRRRDQQKKEASATSPTISDVFLSGDKPPQYSPPGDRVGIFFSSTDNTTEQGNCQSTYQIPQSGEDNGKQLRSDSPTDEARQSELHRMASIRLHQQLVQSHDKWPMHSSELNKEKTDNHSDMSGETITSDSGVGCSDTHSTMSHSHQADEFRNSKFGTTQIGRRGTPPHLSNNHTLQIPNHTLPPQNHYSNQPPLYQNIASLHQYSQSKMLSSAGSTDLSHHLPPHVRTFYQPRDSSNPSSSSIPSYGHFQRGIYSHQNMDETLDSVATGYDDDDTTTSGSYTIDAEEYPIEMRLQKVPDVFV